MSVYPHVHRRKILPHRPRCSDPTRKRKGAPGVQPCRRTATTSPCTASVRTDVTIVVAFAVAIAASAATAAVAAVPVLSPFFVVGPQLQKGIILLLPNTNAATIGTKANGPAPSTGHADAGAEGLILRDAGQAKAAAL